MGIKKSIENVGRRLIGKGREVVFSNSVAEYEESSGVSKEEAEKVIFLERFKSLSDELTLTGTLDFKSQEYRDFTAGMNEVFGTTDIEAFKADALLSTFPYPSVAVSPAEFKQMKKQFQDFFEGNAPCNSVLAETAENIKEMKELLARFSSHPGLGSTPTLQDLISAYPDAGADLGMILLLKEHIDKNIEQFESSLGFEKELDNLKKQTKEIISASTLGEVGRFFGSIWKSTGEVTKGNFAGAMLHASTAVARLTTKGLIGAGKLEVAFAKTGASYINKSMKK